MTSSQDSFAAIVADTLSFLRQIPADTIFFSEKIVPAVKEKPQKQQAVQPPPVVISKPIAQAIKTAPAPVEEEHPLAPPTYKEIEPQALDFIKLSEQLQTFSPLCRPRKTP
jgi:hypothetical protein